MTKIERLFPIFGIIFAVVYAYVLYHDAPLATYHPMLGEWDFGRVASRKGPAMYLVRTRAHGVRRGRAVDRAVRVHSAEVR